LQRASDDARHGNEQICEPHPTCSRWFMGA
jgi:hypothetical protein